MLILSLFPGLGLLDHAFEEVWTEACVVRAPDKLWGGDIKSFHVPAGKFDGIIGGPPCKAFSRLKHIVKLNRDRELAADPDSTKYAEAENLIPEFVRVVNEAQPAWFLMENVVDVPPDCWPVVTGYQHSSLVLNNRWLPGASPQNRQRRFWFGCREKYIDLMKYIDFAVFEPLEWEYAVTAAGSGGGAPVPVRQLAGGELKAALRQPKSRPNTRTVQEYLTLQGLPADLFDKNTPFTVAGQRMMIGNGVPLPMGRAIAKAIKEAL